MEQRRPTAVEMVHAGVKLSNIRNRFGSWFGLVAERKDLGERQRRVFQRHQDYFREIETSAMTKSYKMVLLEAMLELDGFVHPQATDELAIRSGKILLRRPALIQNDLPGRFKDLADALENHSRQWLTYWNSNPVNAFIGGNKKQGKSSFFTLEDGRLKPTIELATEDRETFHAMVQELVDYKLTLYMEREPPLGKPGLTVEPVIPQGSGADWGEINYYPNLKIACGHFRDAGDENKERVKIPPFYRADPSRHFIARASGNSMDGGKNPIRDGDYLLMEKVSSDSAGSITGQIMAVERQDVAGDDQYVLRVVRKRGARDYYLQANNPDYTDFDASDEEMRTFARFRAVIPSKDVIEN